MKVSNELFDKLSVLSRLEFTDQEKEEIKSDIERMIIFIDKLNELNLDEVMPTLHMSNEINILRKDEINGQINNIDAFLNAPLHDNLFFKVPKVLKEY